MQSESAILMEQIANIKEANKQLQNARKQITDLQKSQSVPGTSQQSRRVQELSVANDFLKEKVAELQNQLSKVFEHQPVCR